jgi:predicted CoA-substrate-specific enzyme activase
MFLGIDIGSSSSKAVIIDDKKRARAQRVVNMGTGTKGINMAIEQALAEAGITMEGIRYSVVTGYGRMTYKGADVQITEITCHAKGVSFVAPEACTVIDIGGQDAKAISLGSNGQVNNFVMNEKCAAGTGRFLEVMARVLGCAIDELADLAKTSARQVNISSICTVFAESEVISQLASGSRLADVAQGAHAAIAKRVAGMAGRVGIKPMVVMTGGVALNSSLVDALSTEIKSPIFVPEYPQSMGALGAALIAWEKFDRAQ